MCHIGWHQIYVYFSSSIHRTKLRAVHDTGTLPRSFDTKHSPTYTLWVSWIKLLHKHISKLQQGADNSIQQPAMPQKSPRRYGHYETRSSCRASFKISKARALSCDAMQEKSNGFFNRKGPETWLYALNSRLCELRVYYLIEDG